jgi:hypothetical protein
MQLYPMEQGGSYQRTERDLPFPVCKVWASNHNQGRPDTRNGEPSGLHMTDELLRKNIQVTVDIWETLTALKHGNMTYSDVLIEVLAKAKIPLAK